MVSLRRLALLGAAAAALAACSGPSPATHPTAPPPAGGTAPGPAGGTAPAALSPPPDGVRLPTGARPLSYQLALTADPAATTFRGRATIEIELTAPAHPLWLNAEELTIDVARLRRDGGAAVPLRVVPGPLGVIGLAAAAPIAPGKITVELEYRGAQGDEANQGVMRRTDRGDHYLATQLESMGARRVLPCFDEPGYKVPWQLELTVPAGVIAASNTPIESDEPLADGQRRVRFAATPPLPSYLIAFAVGPFDVVDAGKTRHDVPMRVLAPRGRGPDVAFMAAQSAPLVAALEDYTGIPFPYAKLDHVVVPPSFGGAMENAGMITYSLRLLVIPASETDAQRANATAVMAHELAHQWFGDLVTLAWWDDIWLNEAFATWAANRLMAELHPELGGASAPVSTRRVALSSEADPSARAVRQPIVEKIDIERAFDGITYDKGATVLRMFEEALGPDKFRAGLQRYLNAHAHGNATAADLMSALSADIGVDVAARMAPWLDQPGAPVVEVSLECPGGGAPAALALRQHRYQAARPAAGPATGSTWHIPVCVRLAGENTPRCMAMEGETARLELGARCPKIVIPSASGQYLTAPDPALRRALVGSWAALTASERIAFAGDTAALVEARELEIGALLDLLPRLTATTEPDLIRVARNLVVDTAAAATPADRVALARVVRASFGKLATRLGWRPRPRDSYQETAIRQDVMTTYVEFGGDAKMSRATIALARAWLKDRSAVPVTLVSRLLRTAIRVDTDGALFDALATALPAETEPEVRRPLANALGETTDPARLVRAMELVASQPTLLTDHLAVFWGADDLATTTVRVAYLRDHLPALLPRLTADWRSALSPSTCDATLRPEVVTLLDTYFVPLPDYGASSRDRAVASMDLCISQRAILTPAISKYFARR